MQMHISIRKEYQRRGSQRLVLIVVVVAPLIGWRIACTCRGEAAVSWGVTPLSWGVAPPRRSSRRVTPVSRGIAPLGGREASRR